MHFTASSPRISNTKSTIFHMSTCPRETIFHSLNRKTHNKWRSLRRRKNRTMNLHLPITQFYDLRFLTHLQYLPILCVALRTSHIAVSLFHTSASFSKNMDHNITTILSHTFDTINLWYIWYLFHRFLQLSLKVIFTVRLVESRPKQDPHFNLVLFLNLFNLE